MKSPILGSAYVARSVNAADNRMVNLYPEVVPEGGLELGFLQRAPGLRKLALIGKGPIRGVWAIANSDPYAYVVSGNQFYRIDGKWNAKYIGPITNTGPVSMADNGTQIFIAANGPSYIYNKDTGELKRITDPDFPGAGTVGYLDGYFVFNQPNSQKIWVTSLFDGTAIDALDFASAEGSPDGVVGLIVNHRELWVFGTNSTEVWYDAGLADFPLARIQGAFNELGCVSPNTIAKVDNSVFWLGQDARGQGIVYRAEGYIGRRLSTHAIEWQIQQFGDLSEATAYTYQQDGHSFYVLNLPSANTTWVYDIATGAWHERASLSNGFFTRHRANCQMFFNDKTVVGDYQNGNIYEFDLNYFADDDVPQKWLRSWRALPTGTNTLRRTTHHSLQLECETGVGLDEPPNATDLFSNELIVGFLLAENDDVLATEDDNQLAVTEMRKPTMDPRVMLRWSDDGGHTWSNEHWKSMGRIGAYSYRTIWRRLGMTMKLRDRVYEVSGTDPVKIAIMGAELIMSPTNA